MKLLGFALAGVVISGFLLASPLFAQQKQEASGSKAPNAADKSLGSAVMGAVVSQTGALERGIGVLNVTKGGTGQFRVLFERDITQCIYTANVAELTNYFAVLREVVGVPNAVDVLTLRWDSVLANVRFHMTVICGR